MLILGKKISGIIFSSIISALDDFMGVDGVNSILKFARLEEYITKQPSRVDSVPLQYFHALIESMCNVMGYGTDQILFHYGKNYLALKLVPFMTDLSEFIKNFQEWSGGNWIILKNDPYEKIIQIFNSPFSSINSPNSFTPCNIIRGIFENVLEQITGEQYKCEERKCLVKGNECCEFYIKKIL